MAARRKGPPLALSALAAATGLALVVFPEPATTATGLAILAATFAANTAGKGK